MKNEIIGLSSAIFVRMRHPSFLKAGSTVNAAPPSIDILFIFLDQQY
jgi:hypothetical protein